jgi:gp16 family phage-associated protein
MLEHSSRTLANVNNVDIWGYRGEDTRMSTTIRTPEEARAWLSRHGVTITEWARARGFKPAVVAALLAGRTRGRWGEAHDAAVALGLREAPQADEEHPLTGLAGQGHHLHRGVTT